MFPCDLERLSDDRFSLGRQTELGQIMRIGVDSRVGIRPMAERSTYWTAQIVNQHEVILDTLFLVQKNAVEDFDDWAHLDDEPCLLERFSGHSLFEGFADFERSTRQTPLSRQWLESPPNQDDVALVLDHRADSDNRAGWIAPRIVDRQRDHVKTPQKP